MHHNCWWSSHLQQKIWGHQISKTYFPKAFKSSPNLLILQLPYPLMASLNGIAMFAQSHDVTVLTAQSKDSKLMWRDYHDSLRLIIALPLDTLSDVHIYR